MMIVPVFVGLVLAIGTHVEAAPTPKLEENVTEMDLVCTRNHRKM